MSDFDVYDKDSWYCGPMSREEANEILMKIQDPGVFFIRDSTSIRGDFVLCVRESQKVSHYIIHKTNANGLIKFKIGEKEFPDLGGLLSFYKTHYLDTTALTRPLQKECVEARWNFAGNDDEDLPFKKGEILTVLRKEEEAWWLAKNSEGKKGLIPANYVVKVESTNGAQPNGVSGQPNPGGGEPEANITLPCRARCIQDRNPSAYDRTQLRFKIGDIVIVRAMNVNGQWDGELEGSNPPKTGSFPFTHVEIIRDDSAQ